MNCCFRKAQPGEAEIVYSMITDRIRWMDKKGIRQWNTDDYLEYYPPAYYRENLDQLFVLTDQDSGKIECAAILFDRDPRWNSDASAFYVHNFVSGINSGHAGRRFLHMAEKYAAQQGKQYLRLDSPADNSRLSEYYESLGFAALGTCQEGTYQGILRQKELINRWMYLGVSGTT